MSKYAFKTLEEIFGEFDSNIDGLEEEAIISSKEKYGANIIQIKKEELI